MGSGYVFFTLYDIMNSYCDICMAQLLVVVLVFLFWILEHKVMGIGIEDF